MLADYPAETIRFVTDPRSGIASKCAWLPNVKEVRDACEEHYGPQVRSAEREQRVLKQIEERQEIPDATTYRPRYGAKIIQWNEEPPGGRPIGRFEKVGDKWNKHIPREDQ